MKDESGLIVLELGADGTLEVVILLIWVGYLMDILYCIRVRC
jgi:hypothetical protein